MNILNILNNKELSDIHILYILRIINAIQKESINGKSGIQGLFVSYMRNRTKENLGILLSTIRKMLSELYMTCDLDEKEIFKKHLGTLQNITQPNII